jgi:acetyl esterase/lipase
VSETKTTGDAVIYTTLLCSVLLGVGAFASLIPAPSDWSRTWSFVVGWLAGELTVQAIVIQVTLLGVQAWWGWPQDGALVTALWCVGALVIAENLALIAIQRRATSAVARAARTSEPPISLEDLGRDRYGRWWRTAALWSLHPRDLVVTRDVPYGPLERHPLDVWHSSAKRPAAPVVLFVHGGAWTLGSKFGQGRPMLHEFTARGWLAVCINYRLAPGAPWPAQIEDVTRALGWVKTSIAQYGGDPDKVVVVGNSAGGHLVSLLALTADDPTWRPEGSSSVTDWTVAGCISQYGVLEMTGDPTVWRGHGTKLRHLLERAVVQSPYVGHEETFRSLSPIERITPSAPPFLVIQGGNDTLVDRNVAVAFVAKFKETATAPVYLVELPRTQHAFDLTASPRTTAVTRIEVGFAESVVALRSAGAPTRSAE